jgi:hypothetical protein
VIQSKCLPPARGSRVRSRFGSADRRTFEALGEVSSRHRGDCRSVGRDTGLPSAPQSPLRVKADLSAHIRVRHSATLIADVGRIVRTVGCAAFADGWGAGAWSGSPAGALICHMLGGGFDQPAPQVVGHMCRSRSHERYARSNSVRNVLRVGQRNREDHRGMVA